jgi:hypothetical protein
MGINIVKLHRELETVGLPVVGVAANGRLDWSRELSESETAQAKAIVEAHDPTEEVTSPTEAERIDALEIVVYALTEAFNV